MASFGTVIEGVRNNTAEELDLSDSKVSLADLAVLVVALQHNTRLKRLYLSGNNLGNGCIDALKPMLANGYCKLSELFLNRNGINDVGAKQLLECLKSNGSAHLSKVTLGAKEVNKPLRDALEAQLKENISRPQEPDAGGIGSIDSSLTVTGKGLIELPPLEYEILDAEALYMNQKKDIEAIAEITKIPVGWSRILLRKSNWNKDTVLQSFFDKGRAAVCTAAGIDFREEDMPDAANPNKPKTDGKMDVDGEATCESCFDELPLSQTYALSCGHRFCKDCWGTYTELKVNEGLSKQIWCMGPGCRILLDEVEILNLLKPNSPEAARFLKAMVESFVEDNPYVKWCPSTPHCGSCVKVHALGSCVDIQCRCGHAFCFTCMAETHSPATCEMLVQWNKRVKDGAEADSWIQSKARPCPQCKTPIEKNGGCNHISCRCGCHFCWACMKPFSTAQVYNHGCNMFVEPDTTPVNNDIERFTHFHERFTMHANSEALEATLRQTVITQLRDVRGNPAFVASMLKALDALCQSRHILKNSYLFAFYMFRPPEEPPAPQPVGRDIFFPFPLPYLHPFVRLPRPARPPRPGLLDEIQDRIMELVRPGRGRRPRPPEDDPVPLPAPVIRPPPPPPAQAAGGGGGGGIGATLGIEQLSDDDKWYGLFAHHQQQLESHVEQLSGLLEQPLFDILSKPDLQKSVEPMATLALDRLRVVYDLIQTELLGADSRLVASFHPSGPGQPSPYHMNSKDLLALLRSSAPAASK